MPAVPSIRQNEAGPRGWMLRLFGYEIMGRKANEPAGLAPPSYGGGGGGGWFPIVREPYAGAWQRNILDTRSESVVTYFAVYACVTRIAQDIAKMRLRLVEQDKNGIWSEADSSAFSPVLRKPNHFQNRIKFIEQWLISKLLHGNTYIIKERDARGVVVALYVLDPLRTKPLVAPDGSVYYQLSADYLSGLAESTVVPASEIIHDVMVPLYHPLCGVSPLTASGLAACQGLAIQRNSARFFQNGAQPSGVLTAPGEISDPDAQRFKDEWIKNYTGENAGKVAVLGGGLKYEAMSVNAIDAQLIEQLKWTAKNVCSTYHVPGYMVGVDDPPAYNNIDALNQQYYVQCLQSPIECIELLLDEGLGLDLKPGGRILGAEFDLDDLLRMDSKTLAETEKNLAGIKAPNESRKRLNLPPVKGGGSPYLQQQNYSLEALARRDAKDDPFASKAPAAAATDAPTPANDDIPDDQVDAAASLFGWELKSNLRLELPSIDAA
jgi:HK97 family phage portal protein